MDKNTRLQLENMSSKRCKYLHCKEEDFATIVVIQEKASRDKGLYNLYIVYSRDYIFCRTNSILFERWS